MTQQAPEFYENWTEDKFQGAHARFVEQCISMRAMTRETLLEYGRALNAEITRRQGIVRVTQNEHEHLIVQLTVEFEGISKLLRFLPRLTGN